VRLSAGGAVISSWIFRGKPTRGLTWKAYDFESVGWRGEIRLLRPVLGCVITPHYLCLYFSAERLGKRATPTPFELAVAAQGGLALVSRLGDTFQC
jgi:hypothetical protein